MGTDISKKTTGSTSIINRRMPEFTFTPKKVVTNATPGDIKREIPSSNEPITIDEVPPDVIKEAATINSVNSKLDSVGQSIDDQTADMAVVVDSNDWLTISAVTFLSNGRDTNVIKQDTWKKALEIKYNSLDIVGKVQEFDFVDAVWIEIKLRICKWIKDLGVPVLSDKMQQFIEELEQRSFRAKSGMDDQGRPLSVSDMTKYVTGSSFNAVTHADRVINYINTQAANESPQQWNAAAVSLKPALDGVRVNHDSLTKVVEKTWGPFSFVKTDNGFDLSKPVYDSSVTRDYIRNTQLFSAGKKHQLWDATGYIADRMLHTVDQYLSTVDFSCCLFENLVTVSKISDKNAVKLLQGLRLALMYSYNGINFTVGSQFDSIINVLNAVVSKMLNSITTTMQDAVDDWLVDIRNKFNSYVNSRPSSWRRCTPFDEMMRTCLTSMYQMEADLVSYLDDLFNTMQNSYPRVDEYTVNINKREYIRTAIMAVDILINGVQSGTICKDIDTGNFMPLTPGEVKSLINDAGSRNNVSPSRLTATTGVSQSGTPVIDGTLGLSDKDRMLIQDCHKVLTEDEVADLEEIIGSGERTRSVVW